MMTVGPSSMMTEQEREYLMGPLVRSLQRLPAEQAALVMSYFDPLCIVIGIGIWGSRVGREWVRGTRRGTGSGNADPRRTDRTPVTPAAEGRANGHAAPTDIAPPPAEILGQVDPGA